MADQSALFEIHDQNELNALWRLVAEAKFSRDPDDLDLWVSQIVRDLANRVAQGLARSHKRSGDLQGLERHRDWVMSLPNNVVLPDIVFLLQRDARLPFWPALSHSEKQVYVRDRIAPFQVDDEFLDDLINRVEA